VHTMRQTREFGSQRAGKASQEDERVARWSSQAHNRSGLANWTGKKPNTAVLRTCRANLSPLGAGSTNLKP
jgi:hypothetical protein